MNSRPNNDAANDSYEIVIIVRSNSKEELIKASNRLEIESSSVGLLFESSQMFSVRGTDIRIDSRHTGIGQRHAHVKLSSGEVSLNVDGSVHDGKRGYLTNKISDFLVSKGFRVPNNNLIESEEQEHAFIFKVKISNNMSEPVEILSRNPIIILG